MKIVNKTIVISVLTASSILAATPNVDAIQKSVTTPKVIEEKNQENKNDLIEIGGVKKYAPQMAEDTSGKKINVKSFKIDGAIHVDEKYLQTLISSYNNKDLTFAQIKDVTSIITKEYREKGYFVARAYLPVQSMQNGIVTIAIIEGSYGEFKLTNKSNVNDYIVQNILSDAKARDNVVSTNTLERSMLLINDTPGVTVTKADVKPGTQVGSSDFVIETQATPFYDGYVVADNYGSKYTGKNRLMSGVNLNSPLHIGDKLSVSGLVSNGEDIKNYKVGYEFPLMSNGLRGQTSYSKTDYNLINLAEEGYGNTSTVEVGIIYPITRTRLENLNLSTVYANKELKDNGSSPNSRKINSVKVGLDYIKNHTLLGFDSTSKIETFYTLGKLDIKDENAKNRDTAGPNNQGSYSKVNVNLGSEIVFTSLYSLNTNLKTQYALNNKNLDGSEDFTLGGMEGVKVFSDAEQSIENAVVFNTEFQIKLPEVLNLTHKVGFFYDVGTGDMSNSQKDTQFEKRTLQDMGIGYYTNYKNAFTKLQIAKVVGGQDIQAENVGNNSRVLVQGGLTF